MRIAALFLALSALLMPFGTIRSLSGTAMVERGSRWEALAPGGTMAPGDRVRTADGMVRIVSAETVIAVGSNTIVTIGKAPRTIDVFSGTVIMNGSAEAVLPSVGVRIKNASVLLKAGSISRVAAGDTSAGDIDVAARGKNNEAIRLKPGMTVYGKPDGSIAAEVPITSEQRALFGMLTALPPDSKSNAAAVIRPNGPFVLEPADDAVITGNAVTVNGHTVPGSSVTINGFILSVASNGAFGPASIYCPVNGKNRLVVSVTGSLVTNIIRTITAEHTPPAIRSIVISGLRDGASLTPELAVTVKAAGAQRISANGFPLKQVSEGTFTGAVISFKSGAYPLSIEAVSRGGSVSRAERTVIFDIDTPFLIVREPIALPLLAGISSRSARITVRINDTIVIDRNAAGGSFTFDLSKALAPYRGHNVKISVSCEDVYGRSGTSYAVTRYFDL